MGNLKIWNRVPHGSHLEVWVDPPQNQPFVASARLVGPDGTEEQWTDADLRPGPKVHPLGTARHYTVRLRVGFAGNAAATIRARILKPGGTVYGKEYAYPIQGANGDVVRATIVVVMLKVDN